MPKILTPSGIKKLEKLKTILEAITLEDPDETTSKTLFHAKKLVEWGLTNNSITGFLSKTAKEHLSEVLNSKDCNAIEVFNDETRSIALTLISFIKEIDLKKDLFSAAKIPLALTDNPDQQRNLLIRDLEIKIQMYDHLSQMRKYEQLEGTWRESLSNYPVLNAFLAAAMIEKTVPPSDCQVLSTQFQEYLNASLTLCDKLPYVHLKSTCLLSTQEPYQLALKGSNLHFVSSAAKIWEYLLQYQNKINDYLVSNEQNPLTLLQDKMPAKEGVTSPLSLTRLTNWFTEQAESYKNNNGNKEVNVKSKFPFFSKPESVKPPKKVAQPDDVALLLTLAKTLRINLEFKKSDPGMFINCFNLLNSLVAAAPSSTFKELNLKQGNFLIFELFQNLFKLIIKLDPHNDPFLTAALQPKIDATPRPS